MSWWYPLENFSNTVTLLTIFTLDELASVGWGVFVGFLASSVFSLASEGWGVVCVGGVV